MPHSSGYRFGSFTLIRETRALWREARRIPLGERATDLLFALVESGTQTVRKPALLKRAWPNSEVDESTLRFHIASLRRALEDSGHGSHRYIVNISGRGYCFVAPVERLQRAPTGVHIEAREAPDLAQPPQVVHPAHRLVGREQAMEDLCALLAQRRCVSVVGAGGMGKSSLAFAAAEQLSERFPDGLFVLDVALIADGALVASTLAHQVGTVHAPGTAVNALCAWFRNRRCLLILDSCETQVEACAFLTQALLLNAPDLRVLVTSREALRIQGECLFQLKPLALPPRPWEHLSLAEATRYPAIQLVLARAGSLSRSFVAQEQDAAPLCELVDRLDGMPLAIELAAARLDRLPLPDLLRQLEAHLLVSPDAVGSGPDRHRTLSGMLDWSFERLDGVEQDVLRRLSVCNGAFPLASAQAIASTPALGEAQVEQAVMGLEAKSLLSVDHAYQPVRYRLLDSTRAYAAAKLGRTRAYHEARVRQCLYLQRAIADSTAHGAQLRLADWLHRYGSMNNDLRENIAWAFGPDGAVACGVRLVAAAVPYVHQMALAEEYRPHVERALAALAEAGMQDPELEYQLLQGLGVVQLMGRGPGPAVEPTYRRAAALATQLGQGLRQSEALNGLFNNAFYGIGNYPVSASIAQEITALSTAMPDLDLAPLARRVTLMALHGLGQHEQARTGLEAMLQSPTARQRLRPPYPSHIGVMGRMALVRIFWLQGRAEDAREMAEELLDLAAEDQRIAITNAYAWSICPLYLWTGDQERARQAVLHMHECAMQINMPYAVAWARAFDQAWARQHNQSPRLAESWVAFAPGSEAAVKSVTESDIQIKTLALATGVIPELAATAHASLATPLLLARAHAGTLGWCTPEVLRIEGEQAANRSDPDTGVRLFERAISLARDHGALAWELRAATSLASLRHRQGDDAAARATLAPVHARFHQGHHTADLRRAQALLARLAGGA